MLSRPDIVVGKPESSEILLVVECKTRGTQASADALKEYLVRQNCPAGILITPETTVFLTNRYTGFQPSSIEQTGTVLWLDTLAVAPWGSWPTSARESSETLVLPAVEQPGLLICCMFLRFA
jgi:hypothetical protein